MNRLRVLVVGGSVVLASALGAVGYFFSKSTSPQLLVSEARYRDGRGRMGREGPRSTAATSRFCDRFSASDKSGNWFCLNGDGTMASGSQRTLTATGTPGSAASSCAGASTINFTATTQRFEQSVTESFPASDFTVCMQLTVPSTPNGLETASFGTGGAPSTSTVLPCELGSNRKCTLYISNNSAYSTLTATNALTADTPAVVCVTYVRTGGAADNVATFYLDGSANGTSSAQRLASGLTSGWAFNGVYGNPGLGAFPFKSDGLFVTYTALSSGRISALSAVCQ